MKRDRKMCHMPENERENVTPTPPQNSTSHVSSWATYIKPIMIKKKKKKKRKLPYNEHLH